MSSAAKARKNLANPLLGEGMGKTVAVGPELSPAERLDLVESEKEFKEGKGKRFKDARSLLDELESESDD